MSSILVVEDDRSTRQLLTEMLKTAGFSVTSAKDGVDALKRLRAGSYDLMLLDVWMPKMNGLDVLAALPKEEARPRVVVMTSDDTPETLLRAVREQAWRYVAKPVEPQALVQLLREVLAQTAVAPRIEVVSARPDWVELLVPCERAVVDRIESFMTASRKTIRWRTRSCARKRGCDHGTQPPPGERVALDDLVTPTTQGIASPCAGGGNIGHITQNSAR